MTTLSGPAGRPPAPSGPPAGAPLVARTVRVRGDVDLLAVAGGSGVLFARGGCGLGGRGEALRVPLGTGTGRADAADAAAEALAGIEHHDEVGVAGSGPVGFVALPFDDRAPASVVVPSLVAGRSGDGTAWVTTVGPAGEGDRPALVEAVDGVAPEPRSFRVGSAVSPQAWCEAVASAVAAIRDGGPTKVVLAREVVVEADTDLDSRSILDRLAAAAPGSILYAVDGLIGASPELLVSRRGDVVRSQPMAGTTARTGDPGTDAALAATLLASAKDRAEHQITIDMVLDTILAYCSYVDSEPEPSIAAAGNVQHLASMVEGRLSSPPASVLTLVGALHPTPAVCGWPRAEALALIGELEQGDRGRYAGAVGWLDADGNGSFAVALRGIEIDGRRGRIWAGSGIVADSDPQTELAETRAKLQAVLAATVRP